MEETDCLALLAVDGIQALKIVEAKMPNLFILDYFLLGMNGIELYDRICLIKELERIPAIMISANLPRCAVQARRIVGIHKPFEILDVLDAVMKTLM